MKFLKWKLIEVMNKNESNDPYKMDRSRVIAFNSFEEANAENSLWMDRSVEERFLAIEFLRAQWIELNNLSTVMDKSFFVIR